MTHEDIAIGIFAGFFLFIVGLMGAAIHQSVGRTSAPRPARPRRRVVRLCAFHLSRAQIRGWAVLSPSACEVCPSKPEETK